MCNEHWSLRPRKHYAGKQSAFGFDFEENSSREISWFLWRHRFRKAPFLKCFSSTLQRKAGGFFLVFFFKFFRFEERSHKAPFSRCFLFTREREASVFKFECLKSVSEKPWFRDGSAWTAGQTVEIKFSIRAPITSCCKTFVNNFSFKRNSWRLLNFEFCYQNYQ